MNMLASPVSAVRPAGARTQGERPSLGFRVRIWWRRGALDAQLADGTDPGTTPALAYRAAQITTPAFRAGLASGFERVLEAAEEAGYAFSSRAPLRRAEIVRSRGLLGSVAYELRCDQAARPQGVALAQRLLIDGCGPLYTATCADDVAHAAREALHAL